VRELTTRLLVETDPKKLNALVEQMTRIVEDNRLVRTFAQSGTRLLGISEGVILSTCRSETSQLSAAQRVSIPFLPEAHSVRLLAPAIYRVLLNRSLFGELNPALLIWAFHSQSDYQSKVRAQWPESHLPGLLKFWELENLANPTQPLRPADRSTAQPGRAGHRIS
jgi:hypothetical protein